MIVFLPVCAFEVYWCLLYAVLMSASTGSCSKPCSLCKEIQHPDVMVCILLHIIYLTCKARSSYRLLGSAVDFSQQTVPMSCYSWSNCTSPTHKSCWSTYWVVQKKTAQSFVHHNFWAIRCRMALFAAKCSAEFTVYQSMQNLCDCYKYSLLNTRQLWHVIGDVTCV